MNADLKPLFARSPHWPAVRAAHLKAEPACAACGGTDRLEVHHVQPFHVFPALELDDANLLTLCEAPGRNCHYAFGHAFHWHGWVPSARQDVAAFRKRYGEAAELAATPAAPTAVALPGDPPPPPPPQPESNR